MAAPIVCALSSFLPLCIEKFWATTLVRSRNKRFSGVSLLHNAMLEMQPTYHLHFFPTGGCHYTLNPVEGFLSNI